MANEDTNKENAVELNKSASIRTLKDDIAKATLAKKSGQEIPEPWPVQPPIPPKKEVEKVDNVEEIPKINPFIRSDILPFKDGEIPENPRKTAFEVSPLRTYTSDVAQEVKTGNTSVIQIAVAEQKEREKEQQIEHTVKSRFRVSIAMIIGSIVLLALGAGIFYYIFTQKSPETIVEIPKEIALIASESEKEIIFSADQKKFLEELNEAVTVASSTPGIQNIKVIDQSTGKAVTSLQFLSLIAVNIPQSLVRSFTDEFAFGIYSGETSTPFIILKIDSFENAFAGMLKWEETMRSDIGGLILDKAEQDTSLAIGTSTPLSVPGFKDSVLKNQDARVAVNRQGKIILLYSFINKDILIITRNPETLDELIQRLRSTQIVR